MSPPSSAVNGCVGATDHCSPVPPPFLAFSCLLVVVARAGAERLPPPQHVERALGVEGGRVRQRVVRLAVAAAVAAVASVSGLSAAVVDEGVRRDEGGRGGGGRGVVELLVDGHGGAGAGLSVGAGLVQNGLGPHGGPILKKDHNFMKQ